jgi:hypothetical protein
VAEGINSKQWQPWLELYLNNLSLSQIVQIGYSKNHPQGIDLLTFLFLTMANLVSSFPFQTK